MKAVSLFAGVGGFDLALERAGVTVVASCEIDKYAQKVLAEHFPNSTIINDVKDVTGDQLKQLGFDGNDGIIVGGFPCQDLSVAGKRAGLAGSRSGLFWEICRILDETKAKWFVLENVPGLLSSNDGRDMGTVIQALVERGYGVSYRILDAQYFGVAQRRRRVFIVGCLGDDGRASAEVLSIVEGMRGHHSQSDKAGKETTRSVNEGASETSIKYPKRVGTITTAFGAKNYSNHQELMEGSVVVYDELVHQESQSAER